MATRIIKRTVYGLLLPVLLGLGGYLQGQETPLGFRIPGATIVEKDTFIVTIHSDSLLTGRSVYSYRFYLTYSPTYLQFIDIEEISPILSGWGDPVVRNTNPGTLILTGAGANALSGSGAMIRLKFLSLRSGGAYLYFNSTESYLNERNPASRYTDGYFNMTARSYPNIYPDSREMLIGDEVQMTVSGGVSPYVYSVENPLVAAISEETKVRAIGSGTTRILVTDSRGDVSYTTGVFDVRSIRILLEEGSAWPGDTFYIPVKLEIFPGTSVFSGRFDLVHDGGLSGLTGAVLPGDFDVSIQNKAISGKTTVSFATATPVTGNGVLCYLGFRANSSGSRSIRFENIRFNEVLLAWPSKSYYYISVNYQPNLSFSPNSGTLIWGDLLKINVYNGTPPYTFSVSDTAFASIDAQGWLAAKTGGQVTVTATDVHGATKTTGVFRINDHLLTIAPTEGILDAETRVPIVSTSLPQGKSLYGFSGKVTFDAANLDFKRVDPPNASTLVHSTVSGNTIEFAGASGEGLSSGIIGFLVFQLKSSLPIGGRANINFSSFSANENTILSGLQNGNILRVEQVSYRPVANAGRNFSIFEGATGQLDGTSSYDLDGDSLRYMWIAPPSFILENYTSSSPGFTAPFVSENVNYTIKLVVNDGEADSDTASVQVTVLQVNLAPVADAGENASFAEGSSVSLNGSNSFDPDGNPISFKWTSLDGIILFNPTGAKPSFILPQVTVNTSYRFKLVVNDGVLNSQPDTVTITAIQVNKKPVAFSGGDFSLEENTEGRLDGSLSYDADNDPITYLWTAPPGISLSSYTVPRPYFMAPPVLRDSAIIFTLVVNDGTKNSDPDNVKVYIKNVDILSKVTKIEGVVLSQMESYIIDTLEFTVKLTLPYGSDVRTLAPGFVLSEGASISPASGSTQNFSTPVHYKVIAEDGITSRWWKVEVHAPERIVSRNLNSGWNWISLNVQPENSGITSLFSGLSLTNLDYLKSTSFSSTWYPATGWFGNLVSFPQNRMAQFHKATAEILNITGKEINPTITPVSLVPGWNSLAYLLRSNTAINSSFILPSIPSGNVILKGMDGSSVYYEGTGWVGELDSLRVLHGYKIYVQRAGNILFNPAGSAKKSVYNESRPYQNLLDEYNLQPEKYEYSATLIASVSLDNIKEFDKGTHILAYRGNELRGAAGLNYVAGLGKYVFVLNYYANEEGEDIEFRLRSAETGKESETGIILPFIQDNITGEPLNPYDIQLYETYNEDEKAPPGRIFTYPNPFSDEVIITSNTPIIKLRILNLAGSTVMQENRNERVIHLSLGRLAPGIYTLEVETSNEVMIERIIKTSY